jgi:hypothetical protein
MWDHFFVQNFFFVNLFFLLTPIMEHHDHDLLPADAFPLQITLWLLQSFPSGMVVWT